MLNLLEKFQSRQMPDAQTGKKGVTKTRGGERYLMNAQGDPVSGFLSISSEARAFVSRKF